MDEFTTKVMGYATVFGIGALVGATELMSRYPDSPFRAVRNIFGLSYLLTNACGAIAALYLIREFNWDFGLGNGDSTRLQIVQWLAAALGAMSVLRSSLFNVRLGDNDLGVGPAAVLQVLLSAADRQVDRMRAEERSTAVKNAMTGIDSYAQIKVALPTHCMALMQNVSSDEEKQIRQVAENIEQLEVADCLKVLNLGLVLMNIVGDVVLRTAVGNVVHTQRQAKAEAERLANERRRQMAPAGVAHDPRQSTAWQVLLDQQTDSKTAQAENDTGIRPAGGRSVGDGSKGNEPSGGHPAAGRSATGRTATGEPILPREGRPSQPNSD